jgi:WD40 repeat protein
MTEYYLSGLLEGHSKDARCLAASTCFVYSGGRDNYLFAWVSRVMFSMLSRCFLWCAASQLFVSDAKHVLLMQFVLPRFVAHSQALGAVENGGIVQPVARLCLDSWINALAVQSSKAAPAADVVYAGCADGCIYVCIWDTTLRVGAMLSGHTAPVCSLSWLDTTNTKVVLLSGSWDETAR